MKKMKKMSTANDISQRNWDNKGREVEDIWM
ncbi:predicted protein [Enterococcus faecalis T8]|jgi:hypothetical protein|nr:predicted protein [Enterococcus faecalis T8]EPR45364.1 hypothetical protein EF10244_14105 [Enterococcus faecalis 10244]ERK33908.1 hypothetical protein I131_07615 [Enterococcus faecium CRL1879]